MPGRPAANLVTLAGECCEQCDRASLQLGKGLLVHAFYDIRHAAKGVHYIGGFDEFIGVMTQSILATHEQHADTAGFSDFHSIMPGPAEELACLARVGCDRCGKKLHYLRVAIGV